MTRRALPILALSLALCLSLTATAGAAGDFTLVGHSHMPLEYYQGVTHDDEGNVYFDGPFRGLYRTDTNLREEARNGDVIDPAAQSDPGFNHIGDITFDEAEGGRVILPLECYQPGANPSNTCGIGGFGVADPDSLAWKYWVKLDPSDIPKAMWAEVSPDGKLIWTSSGRDLLAYNASDVVRANAQPAGPAIRPARRLVGAVPAHGITGAVFVGARLFVAGQDGARFQVTSIDLTSGVGRLEIEETINGESEGLDTFRGQGGGFHWMVMPVSSTGPATYESDKGTLLNYKVRPTTLALAARPSTAKAGRRTRFTFTVTDDNGDKVKGATVTFARMTARTDAGGRARIAQTLRRPGRYAAVAKKRGLKTARAIVRSSR